MPPASQSAALASTPYLGRRNQRSASWVNGVPYQSSQFPIGTGDKSIYTTIQHMQALLHGPEGTASPQVRAKALEITRGAVKNVSEIDAVYQWVKQNIRFRGEHEETLQSPVVTLNLGGGDCDDHAMLLAALLESLGYRTEFKIISTARAPRDFSHVYTRVRDKQTKQWLALDTTVGKAHVGWEPPDMYRQQSFPARRRRGVRGLGDDFSFQPLPQIPLVPGVAAPSGLSPGAQAWFDLVQPFAQAGASVLAHGQTANPNFTGNLNFAGTSAGFPSAIPTWLLIGGVALVAFMVIKKR